MCGKKCGGIDSQSLDRHQLWRIAGSLAALWIGAAACSLPAPLDSQLRAEALAATMVVQTMSAAPPSPSATQPPTETLLPPTTSPSRTPAPTATVGPIRFQDDFAAGGFHWSECEECRVEDGALHMGPWPISGAFIQHLAACDPCGWVRNYRMGVDITYGSGPSERGYGLLVRWNETRVMTAEITPWQSVDAWNYDIDAGRWNWLNGLLTGSVRPGRQTNRVEVEVVSGRGSPGATVTVRVNGRSVLTLFNQPDERGAVGLTLYGHAVEAIFDNFLFEELPPYQGEFEGVPSGPTGAVFRRHA